MVLRGITKQVIFEDEEANEIFLVKVNQYIKQSGYLLLAYCLMGNHIHLLLKTGKEELGQIFRRIGASYVYWYNRKYGRSGHLFQDRYKSEAVETDAYLHAVLRYIHQNPLKAGFVMCSISFKQRSFGTSNITCNWYYKVYNPKDLMVQNAIINEKIERGGK